MEATSLAQACTERGKNQWINLKPTDMLLKSSEALHQGNPETIKIQN